MAVVLKKGRYFSYFSDLAIIKIDRRLLKHTSPITNHNLQSNDRGNAERVLARYRAV